MNRLPSDPEPRTESVRFSGLKSWEAGLSGDFGAIDSGIGCSSGSGVMTVSSSGVLGTNGDDFTTVFGMGGFVPLQVKHKDAEPKTFLSHNLHLVNELADSIAVFSPGVGVTGSVGAVVGVGLMSVFEVAMNVSEFSTFSCTLMEFGRFSSRGSVPTTFCSGLSLVGPSRFDMVGRAHEDSGRLEVTTPCRGREGERLAARPFAGLRMSLEDIGGE